MTPLLIAIVCACWGIAAAPVHAGTVVVPDDSSTVTSAIASGADTVLVREGTYAEVAAVERDLVLRGIGTTRRPRLYGLTLSNLSAYRSSVSGFDITTTVTYTTRVGKSPITLSLSDCSMDDGLQVYADDPDAHCYLTISRCRLRYASGGLDVISMDSDTLDGGVSFRLWSHSVTIQNCWFRGGAGAAIAVTHEAWGVIAHNRIDDYDTGISATDDAVFRIEGNAISGCGTGMWLEGPDDFVVTKNEIRGSRVSAVRASCSRLTLGDNTILGAASDGVLASVWDSFVAQGNVVGGCGGAGIKVVWSPWAYYGGLLRSNTVFNNAGSGLDLSWAPVSTQGVVSVENNIGSGNGGWGLSVAGGPIRHGCNDWFGNRSGAVTGTTPDTTDLAVDPIFCGATDVKLDAASPLVAVPGCGPVGALGVGCGARLELVSVEPEESAALVRWRFGLFTPAFTWIERRGEGAGPWERLAPEPVRDGDSYRVLDEGVEPGFRYLYRVGWVNSEGQDRWHSSPVSYQLPSVSRLFPNPTTGPVSVEWTLVAATDMEVLVFDLAGRRVATLARGRFEPGLKSARWNGLLPGGEPAPAGWYVVRVRGGAVNTAHRLLLLR